MSSALELSNIAMRFGGIHVLNDVSVDIEPGEVVGIIGPNGAGKTTLINIISGKVHPTGGRVRLKGRTVTGLPPYALNRLGISRSFQHTNLFRSATVRENLRRAALLSGRRSLSTDFRLLEIAGLARDLDTAADSLPYGAQKLLGLLMALTTASCVLLLDEPAAGLARSERQRVDAMVEAACARSCAVLIVEHDMELIKRLCPRSLVLDAGAIIAEGETSAVLRRPEVIDAYLGREGTEHDADADA